MSPDDPRYISEVFDPAVGPNGLRHMGETSGTFGTAQHLREQTATTTSSGGELTADSLAAMTPEQRDAAYDEAFGQLNIARSGGDRPASPFWAGASAAGDS